MEQLNKERRSLLKYGGVLGGMVALPWLFAPGVVHAEPDFSLDCKVFMFHFESGAGVASIIHSMADEGRVNVLPRDLASALHKKRALPPSYALTLDDGYAMQMNVLNILDKLGARVALYVMGGWRGDGVHKYLTDAQIKEFSDLGNEIGCHTRDHPTNLTALRVNNYGSFLQQIDGAKKVLQEIIGNDNPIRTFAYPYGLFDEPTAQEISNLYLAAFTTQPGNIHYLSRSNKLPRISVN